MIYCDFCGDMVLLVDEKYISIKLDGRQLCWLLCFSCYEKKARFLEKIIDRWLNEEAKTAAKKEVNKK